MDIISAKDAELHTQLKLASVAVGEADSSPRTSRISVVSCTSVCSERVYHPVYFAPDEHGLNLVSRQSKLRGKIHYLVSVYFVSYVCASQPILAMFGFCLSRWI